MCMCWCMSVHVLVCLCVCSCDCVFVHNCAYVYIRGGVYVWVFRYFIAECVTYLETGPYLTVERSWPRTQLPTQDLRPSGPSPWKSCAGSTLSLTSSIGRAAVRRLLLLLGGVRLHLGPLPEAPDDERRLPVLLEALPGRLREPQGPPGEVEALLGAVLLLEDVEFVVPLVALPEPPPHVQGQQRRPHEDEGAQLRLA